MRSRLRAFPLRAPSAAIPCPGAHGPLLSRSELKRLKLLPRVARLLFVVPLDLTSPRRPETLSAGEGVPEAEDAGHKRGAGRRRGTDGSRSLFPLHRAGVRLGGSEGDVRNISRTARAGGNRRRRPLAPPGAKRKPGEPRTPQGGGRAAVGGREAGRGPHAGLGTPPRRAPPQARRPRPAP